MPTVTIYISKEDAELVKVAKLHLKQSLASVFSEALRRKIKRLETVSSDKAGV